jgi:hypothetical protein
MFLRPTDGLYAGQVREFPSYIGRELLRMGRAEDPFAEPVQVEVKAAKLPEAAPAQVPARKRR